MRSEDVTFKTVSAEITDAATGEKRQEMDVIEIHYPDGKVVAFPVDEVSPETGIKYRDMFPAKYRAFKNGEPDPDRVEALEREITAKQAELKALNPTRAKDDERLQENLGYGKRPDVKSEKVAAQHIAAERNRNPPKAVRK